MRLVGRLCEAGLSYGAGCLLVAHAQVEGRVPCHLQDPLKAVVVLLALLYYFFLCKKSKYITLTLTNSPQPLLQSWAWELLLGLCSYS